MICKTMPSPKGGSSASVDYLLNEREQELTARLLEGDPKLTKSLIDNSPFKQRSWVGVLSFEEGNISEDAKREIMKDFEKTFLPGLSKEQYNILWVEHTDKGRLELNFVIPKQELSTGKRLQPYYHKADMQLKDAWQEKINLKYGLSNPKELGRQQTVTADPRKLHEMNYKELDEKLHKLVSKGAITSREQMVGLLRKSGLEVKREGKDYISVKLPDAKKAKRFKGAIYDERFTSTKALRGIGEQRARAIREDNQRDPKPRLREVETKLNKWIEERATTNKKRYAKGAERLHNRSMDANSNDREHTFDRSDSRSIELLPLRTRPTKEPLGSTQELPSRGQRQEVASNRQERPQHTDRQEAGIYTTGERRVNDTTTARRIEQVRMGLQSKAGATKTEVHSRTGRIGSKVREQRAGVRERTNSFRERVKQAVRRTGEKLQQLVRRAERAVKQRTSRGRGGMSRG